MEYEPVVKNRVVGVDVGGTFTDFLLLDAFPLPEVGLPQKVSRANCRQSVLLDLKT